MARVAPEDLAPAELARVFIAATLREAQRAETLLDAQGIDYVITVEALGRTLFGSPRNTAVFSVAAHRADECASLFERAGMGRGVIPAEKAGEGPE